MEEDEAEYPMEEYLVDRDPILLFLLYIFYCDVCLQASLLGGPAPLFLAGISQRVRFCWSLYQVASPFLTDFLTQKVGSKTTQPR
jgi:hypothetical protein